MRTGGYCIYILRCSDGTFYTGSAKDLRARVLKHAAGQGAKYTRSRLPVRLVYQEPCPDRGAALRREAAIKRLPRSAKRRLVREGRKRAKK